MGTSSSFGGKVGAGLLPDDFNPDGENDNLQDEEVPQNTNFISWTNTKTQFSKFINGNGGSNARRTVSNYVKSSGGHRLLTKASKAGVSAGTSLRSFLYNVSKTGLENSLRALGIKLQNHDIRDIYSELVNNLAPNGTTKEECAAREAIADALSSLYEYFDDSGLDIRQLGQVPLSYMDIIFSIYLSSYIWKIVMEDLFSRLEINSASIDQATEVENSMKAFISNSVNEVLRDDNYKISHMAQVPVTETVRKILDKCYLVLEDIEHEAGL